MRQQIRWWLRNIADPRWNLRFHVQRCRTCNRKFEDTEPGAWTSYRDFPELCNSLCRPDRRSHVNCRACGDYCPRCAAGLERELVANREAYR